MTVPPRSIILLMLALIAPLSSAGGRPSTTTSAAHPFVLPEPTGPSPVGTTGWRLSDDYRTETFAEPGVQREVGVLVWYPAALGRGTPAPYLAWGVFKVQGFAGLLGGDRGAFDGLATVRTHATVDAEPASAPKQFPLLVFSHGYGGMPRAYTALLEDLASHGYVVLSIVHPYEAGAAALGGGRLVSFLDAGGRPRRLYRDVIAEWDKEDGTMAAVTSSSDEEEQRRLLRGYLSTLTNTDAALRRWVDDTALVLNRLSTLPRRSLAGRLIARLDTKRIGVLGHAMGGVTAGQFCLEDQRCAAALNLDGIPQYGTMIDRELGKPLLMVYSARPGRRGASDVIYRRAASDYYRVDVAGGAAPRFQRHDFLGGAAARSGRARIHRTVTRGRHHARNRQAVLQSDHQGAALAAARWTVRVSRGHGQTIASVRRGERSCVVSVGRGFVIAIGSMLASMRAPIPIAAAAMLVFAACDETPTSSSPTAPPGASTATVRVVFQGATARRTDLPASAQACVSGVGATHIHPSWRDFAAISLQPVPPDRYEITLADVPFDTRVSFRVNDQNSCDENPTGAVTRNIVANEVRLVQNATTPGNGDEPGFAFTIARSGTISQ